MRRIERGKHTRAVVAAGADRGGSSGMESSGRPGSATPATTRIHVHSLGVARAEPLQGEARYFARIFQIKFVFDVRPVGLHSLGTEM